RDVLAGRGGRELARHVEKPLHPALDLSHSRGVPRAATMMGMAESPLAHSPTLVAPDRALESERLVHGTMAGDNEIEQFICAGAIGDVYAGRHPVIGKRVAIKVLKRELMTDPDAAVRFIREARTTIQIDHPNVINIFAFNRLDDGRLYLAMDLVDGK